MYNEAKEENLKVNSYPEQDRDVKQEPEFKVLFDRLTKIELYLENMGCFGAVS